MTCYGVDDQMDWDFICSTNIFARFVLKLSIVVFCSQNNWIALHIFTSQTYGRQKEKKGILRRFGERTSLGFSKSCEEQKLIGYKGNGVTYASIPLLKHGGFVKLNTMVPALFYTRKFDNLKFLLFLWFFELF